MKSNPNSALADIESLLRAGKLAAARSRLRGLTGEKIAPSQVVAAARLARRLGLPGLSVRLLNPLVRPSERSFRVSTEEERAEYAASLVRLGASHEAIVILDSLAGSALPQVLLFKVLALVSQWRYAETIPLLESYLVHPDVSPYQRLVGKVNLAAALVHERKSGADHALDELREETLAGNHLTLYGNALELSAEWGIARRDWKEADHFLVLAGKATSEAAAENLIYIEKWKTVMQLLKRVDRKSLGLARRTQEKALSIHHWETVRDIDRFKAIALGDEAGFRHLYFGTPLKAFREYLAKDFNNVAVLPDTYSWKIRTGRPAFALDLARPGDDLSAVPHRLLLSLCSDFYRPLRLAELHSQLYPSEFFNPVSSPDRVHQALKRLRQWLRHQSVPLSIEQSQEGYRMVATKPCRLRVGLEAALPPDEVEIAIRRLAKSCKEEAFSSTKASETLGKPLRTVIRFLERAEEQGLVKRSGKARATRYRLAEALVRTT